MSNYLPPAPPAAFQQYIPVAAPVERPGKGLAVGALICGIVGLCFGLIPLLGFFGIILGIVAFVLGLIAARSQKRAGFKRPLARAGWLLGIASVALGVIGMVIVSNAFNQLEKDLDCLGSTPAADCPVDSVGS